MYACLNSQQGKSILELSKSLIWKINSIEVEHPPRDALFIDVL